MPASQIKISSMMFFAKYSWLPRPSTDKELSITQSAVCIIIRSRVTPHLLPIGQVNNWKLPLDMFATSSSSPDPLKTLVDLSVAAQKSPVLEIPGIDPIAKTVQRFYLLVHDVAKEGNDLAR